uniref:AC146-like protein n=1 Tax=Nilaparvata lugens endogenous nudivirus TaxID=1487700 RepID=X5GYA5_9VIRU|nr:AC146-like protein [Nilaparvata lugens endogenous nudivirus]
MTDSQPLTASHLVTHNIPVSSFLLHNTPEQKRFIELNIFYIVSLDIHKRYHKASWFSQYIDGKYLTVDSIKVHIHDGVYRSITYVVEFGKKHRLPSFVYNS